MQTTLPTSRRAVRPTISLELRKHVVAALPQAQARARRRRSSLRWRSWLRSAGNWISPWIRTRSIKRTGAATRSRPASPGISLGTDENGRDLLGAPDLRARISLTVAIFAVLMEIVIGTVLGAIAGYYGGWIDFAIMRFTDVVLSIPLLPLLLVFTAIVSATSNKAALGFGVIVVLDHRARALAARRASRARVVLELARTRVRRSGARARRRRRPDHLPPPAAERHGADHRASDPRGRQRHRLGVDALVSGLRYPTAEARGVTCSPTPRPISRSPRGSAIFPGLCILVTVLAINYLGDGLRDALDPNMR